MKKEYFELSMKWGAKAFDGMREANANLMTTDCPLSAIQIEQATGVRRETASAYLKAAGLAVRPPGRWRRPSARSVGRIAI